MPLMIQRFLAPAAPPPFRRLDNSCSLDQRAARSVPVSFGSLARLAFELVRWSRQTCANESPHDLCPKQNYVSVGTDVLPKEQSGISSVWAAMWEAGKEASDDPLHIIQLGCVPFLVYAGG